MENAAEALKMAFGVFVLIIALSISIYAFSKVRETSEIVIRRTDITEYYEYQDYAKSGKKDEHRVVGIEEIIPMLYRYVENDYKIVFKQGNYSYETGTFDRSLSELDDLTIYRSPVTNQNISYFYLNDEINREAWTGTKETALENLKFVLEGKNVSYNGIQYNYANNPLVQKNSNKRFVEYISSTAKDENDKNDTTLKMQITYVLIKED